MNDFEKIGQLTEKIGSTKVLRVEKWRDASAWRAGIEWFGKDDYEFVCEKATLLECLETVDAYMQGVLE